MNIHPRLLFPALAAALLLAGPLHAQVTLTPDEKGIEVKSNNITVFNIAYPTLNGAAFTPVHKVTSAVPTADAATVNYDGGAVLKVSIASGAIIYTFSNVPADAIAWQTVAIIDESYQKGGTWKMDAGPATPFPAELAPGDAHFFHAPAETFQLTDSGGHTFTFHMPPHAYAELQDNRKFGWAVYAWAVTETFDSSVSDYRMTVSADPASP